MPFNTRNHIIHAEYLSGPNDLFGDRFYGYAAMISQWHHEIIFTIEIQENGTRVAEHIFKIHFTDRDINNEARMLQIVKEYLSRKYRATNVYLPTQRIYYTNHLRNEECEWVENYILTPEALKILEYLKTLVPNNQKLIDGYLLNKSQ